MPRCQYLTHLIDQKIKDVQGTTKHPDKGWRHHLGASIIGNACWRAVWYSYRWATKVSHNGQLLRLFDRGHEEEFRFADWLRSVGANVFQLNPQTGKQYGFKALNGHYAGSTDGFAQFVPYQVEFLNVSFDAWILCEFKTHNENSFKKLVADDSVKVSKPEHYAQAITYMEKFKTPGTIYGAVNKNTDELYWEFLTPDPVFAGELEYKANVIIHSQKPPDRISRSPSWYLCKFCDHRPACHFGAPLNKSCRTCIASLPVDDGRWMCQRFGKLIPEEFEEEGCDYYIQITD